MKAIASRRKLQTLTVSFLIASVVVAAAQTNADPTKNLMAPGNGGVAGTGLGDSRPADKNHAAGTGMSVPEPAGQGLIEDDQSRNKGAAPTTGQ